MKSPIVHGLLVLGAVLQPANTMFWEDNIMHTYDTDEHRKPQWREAT